MERDNFASPAPPAPADPSAPSENVTETSIDVDENMDSGISTEKSESDIPISLIDNVVSSSPKPSTSGSSNAATITSLTSTIEIDSSAQSTSRNSRSRSTTVESNIANENTGMELEVSGDNDTGENDDEDDNDDDDDNDSDTSMDSDFENYSFDQWNEDSNEDADSTPPVLLKRKPIHNYSIIKELLGRETGTLLPPGRTGKTDIIFERKFYGSLHTVERLELMYKLNKHRGCVNSLNFHPEGNLLVSGSDDLNFIIWDWSTNAYRHVVKTDHRSNIFQTKFLHLNTASQLNIVSCARDGQVLLTTIPASGGPPMKRLLAEHSSSAHKLYTNYNEPHIVVSAGEDAQVILADVRQEKPTNLFTVELNDRRIPLYSIAGHPLNVNEMCVAGKHRYVFVYDKRKAGPISSPVKTFGTYENDTKNRRCWRRRMYVTCAVYNHDGTEILASYNEEDIYLFDSSSANNTNYGFSHSYSGHRNSATFKGVLFFGPKSEYIVSGSDCGNIYIWDKSTESIVQWMMGDEGGVVNCMECHPRFPVLATSGLDKDVKIWVPSNEVDPKFDGLRDIVMRNTRPLLYFLPQFYNLHGRGVHVMSDGEDGESNSTTPQEEDDRFDEPSCSGF